MPTNSKLRTAGHAPKRAPSPSHGQKSWAVAVYDVVWTTVDRAVSVL
jgi:hypothetical protein